MTSKLLKLFPLPAESVAQVNGYFQPVVFSEHFANSAINFAFSAFKKGLV